MQIKRKVMLLVGEEWSLWMFLVGKTWIGHLGYFKYFWRVLNQSWTYQMPWEGGKCEECYGCCHIFGEFYAFVAWLCTSTTWGVAHAHSILWWLDNGIEGEGEVCMVLGKWTGYRKQEEEKCVEWWSGWMKGLRKEFSGGLDILKIGTMRLWDCQWGFCFILSIILYYICYHFMICFVGFLCCV